MPGFSTEITEIKVSTENYMFYSREVLHNENSNEVSRQALRKCVLCSAHFRSLQVHVRHDPISRKFISRSLQVSRPKLRKYDMTQSHESSFRVPCKFRVQSCESSCEVSHFVTWSESSYTFSFCRTSLVSLRSGVVAKVLQYLLAPGSSQKFFCRP